METMVDLNNPDKIFQPHIRVRRINDADSNLWKASEADEETNKLFTSLAKSDRKNLRRFRIMVSTPRVDLAWKKSIIRSYLTLDNVRDLWDEDIKYAKQLDLVSSKLARFPAIKMKVPNRHAFLFIRYRRKTVLKYKRNGDFEEFLNQLDTIITKAFTDRYLNN